MLETGLVSLDLLCFLRLSSAGLIVVMVPAVGVAGLILAFPCNTKDAVSTCHLGLRQHVYINSVSRSAIVKVV